MSKTERSSFAVDDRLVLARPFAAVRSGVLEVERGGGEAMGMSCGAGERMRSTSTGEDMVVEDQEGMMPLCLIRLYRQVASIPHDM